MNDSEDRIAVPTNGHRPPLSTEAPAAAGGPAAPRRRSGGLVFSPGDPAPTDEDDMAEETTHEVRVSLTRERPPIGAWLRVGQTYGRVARYLDDGFAVDFQAPPRPGA